MAARGKGGFAFEIGGTSLGGDSVPHVPVSTGKPPAKPAGSKPLAPAPPMRKPSDDGSAVQPRKHSGAGVPVAPASTGALPNGGAPSSANSRVRQKLPERPANSGQLTPTSQNGGNVPPIRMARSEASSPRPDVMDNGPATTSRKARINFGGVQEREFSREDPDAPKSVKEMVEARRRAKEEASRIDFEDAVKPLFDEILNTGQIEKETVGALQEWLDQYSATLPQEQRQVVTQSLDHMFDKTKVELASQTNKEAERAQRLYSEVKKSIEDEVKVIREKLDGGSFKKNIAKLTASSKDHEIQRLGEQLEEMRGRLVSLEKTWRDADDASKKQMEDLVKERDQLKADLAKATPTASQILQPPKTAGGSSAAAAGTAASSQQVEQYEKQIKQLTLQNEMLMKIVQEMRQHRAAREKGAHEDHDDEEAGSKTPSRPGLAVSRSQRVQQRAVAGPKRSQVLASLPTSLQKSPYLV
eukprot:tig00020614_g12139.t2